MKRALGSLVLFQLLLAACVDVESDEPETSSTEESVTAWDFGYGRLAASGGRPTVVIVAEYAGRDPIGHTDAEIRDLVFGPAYPSLDGWFRENSDGAFWLDSSRTGVIRLPLPSSDAIGDDAARLALVKQRLIDDRRFDGTPRFDFTQFDGPDAGTDVGTHELFIIVVENLGDQRGAMERDPGCQVQNGRSICARGAMLGSRASFMSFAHEVSHLLGAVDLYGVGGRNNGVTAMGPTIVPWDDDRRTFHLDPWHKMAFGWLAPRIADMNVSSWDWLRAPHLTTGGDRTMLLYNPWRGTKEYFFAEYRNNDNAAVAQHYDRHTNGNGLGVWHVKLGADNMPVSSPSIVRTGTLAWQQQRRYSFVAYGGAAVSVTMGGGDGVALDVRIAGMAAPTCADSGPAWTVACTVNVPVVWNPARDTVLEQTVEITVRGDQSLPATWSMSVNGTKHGEPFVQHVGASNGELGVGRYWSSHEATTTLIWADGGDSGTRLIPARFGWTDETIGLNWSNKDNYLIDPGFEWQAGTSIGWPWSRWGDGWGGIDTDWFQRGGRKNAWLGGVNGWNTLAQYVPVPTDSCTYELSGWMRTAGNVNEAYFGIRDAADWRLLGEVRFGPHADYRRVVVEVNTGCASDLWVYVIWHLPGSDAWMQIDDLQLRPVYPSGSDSAPYP